MRGRLPSFAVELERNEQNGVTASRKVVTSVQAIEIVTGFDTAQSAV